MHDMLCKCKCKIPPSNALEITLDSWQSNFHTRRADVSQIPFFVWILYYFNGTAEAQLEVAILSYLTKFGGFLPSRNRDNGKQFLGGETFPSVNPSRQISRKPAAAFFLLLIKMFFWGWTCDMIKRGWTRLCLWQCFTVSPQKFCS